MLAGVVDARGEEVRDEMATAGFGDVPIFRDLSEGLKASDCSVVDICLPTDLHADAAIQSFERGCHVFCEKPIALDLNAAQTMVDAATASGRQLMVGHCIRFWPAYRELERLHRSREFGNLLSLSMSRMTGRPSYAIDGWVDDPKRCLGAALDLHIHDTDFLHHLLGTPRQVSSRGIQDRTGWSSISTSYDYEGLIVTAEGAWNLPSSWGFQMRYRAVFERGVVDFDSRAGTALTVTLEGEPPSEREPGDASRTGYELELAYFFGQLDAGQPINISNGEQASRSLGIVLAEIESARTNQSITIN